MPRRRRVLALAAGLLLAGVGAAAWLSRAPDALPPLAVQTLAPRPGIELPERVVVADGDIAFSLSAPRQGDVSGDILVLPLDRPPGGSWVGASWMPLTADLPSLEAFTDAQRRLPEESFVVGEPVLEHSALGAATRKDLAMSETLAITQWAVEHDDHLVLVEWMHEPGDDTWLPTVEAMLGSWRWQ